jgi:hypothetical protein
LTRMTPRTRKVRAAAETASSFRRFNLALNIFQIDACLADSAHAHTRPAPRARAGRPLVPLASLTRVGCSETCTATAGSPARPPGRAPVTRPECTRPCGRAFCSSRTRGGNPMASRPPLTPPRRRDAASCPVAEGAPGSVAGHENPASGSLGNGASSLSEALLASHEGSRIDERVFRDEKRVASPTGAPAASDDETDARQHRQQNTPIVGIDPHGDRSPFAEEAAAARFHASTRGLFRDPASLAGLRGARGGARYAFDPWTKLPVRIESFDRTADSEPRGRRRLMWVSVWDPPAFARSRA